MSPHDTSPGWVKGWIERVFDGYTVDMTVPPTVRLIGERRFDPPRPVEVEHHGRWWPGMQYAWQLCDDHRGWMADVSFTEQHEWGRGTYRPMVPPERVRLSGEGPVSPC